MRGRLRGGLLVAVLIVALGTAGCDWPQFGNDAANTHSSLDPGIGTLNVQSLGQAWIDSTGSATASTPAVASGVTFVGSSDGKLSAFDANGTINCSGFPLVCSPLWTASVGSAVTTSPSVANGIVYAESADGSLMAFDANGVNGCGGSPTVCTPLWTAATGSSASAPVVANGFVYVSSSTGLSVFDASGVTGCSGAPTVCTPLWTAATPSAASMPAVSGGVVYVSADRVYGFDAAGVTNCSGAPLVCAPTWESAPFAGLSAPSVANGDVFALGSGVLYAFDATGISGCSGSPPSCSPLWSSTPTSGQSLAIANGTVFVSGTDLLAFDASGVMNCSGTPTTCQPEWTETGTGGPPAPAVVNGLLYGASQDGITATDATGTIGCSGGSCGPMWSATPASADVSSPVVAQGVLYVGSAGGVVAYKPWTFTRPTCDANPNPGLDPCQLQDAYHLPSAVAGSDRTVAVVDAYGAPNAEADLAVYRAEYGLPPCTTANGCFSKVNQAGLPGPYPNGNTGWSVETSLDLDMVSASCPLCKIKLVEATNNSIVNLAAAQDTAGHPVPAAISNSWGAPEDALETSLDSHFSQATIDTASTGDAGYGTEWPATSPFVTAVGGTDLTADATVPRGWIETAWSNGGSGCSAFEPKPAYQTAATGCTMRAEADIAAIAGNPYLSVYDTYNEPGWLLIGGTSASAPLVAGIFALAPGVGDVANLYRASPGSLFDVTSGSNGTCSPAIFCNAGPGYDEPTGNGTPCGVGGLISLSFVPTDCAAATASANAHAATVRPKITELPYTPVCGPVPKGRARCLSRIVHAG
jgi:hypothetical protein